jgi:hypothetical protein
MQDDSELHNALQILPSVPQNIPHSSENSGIDGTNAEDLSILLPSSLGWEWCYDYAKKGLDSAVMTTWAENSISHGLIVRVVLKGADVVPCLIVLLSESST